MLERFDDIAKSFLAITIWVLFSQFTGHVRDSQKRRSFEQYNLLGTRFLGQIMQISIYDMQVWNQRFHNIPPRLVQALIPYGRAIHLQPFTKDSAVLLDSKGSILDHLISEYVLHEVDLMDQGEDVRRGRVLG